MEEGALEEAYSLMRAFLCLHAPLFSHSFITACRFLWASWLYFSWLKKKLKKNKHAGLLFISPNQHLALIIERWKRMLGLLGLLLDWSKDGIHGKVNNSKLSFYPYNSGEVGLRAIPTLQMSE